jgi:hypothetical protein
LSFCVFAGDNDGIFDGVSGHGWHVGGMGEDPMEGGRGVLIFDELLSSLHLSQISIVVSILHLIQPQSLFFIHSVLYVTEKHFRDC